MSGQEFEFNPFPSTPLLELPNLNSTKVIFCYGFKYYGVLTHTGCFTTAFAIASSLDNNQTAQACSLASDLHCPRDERPDKYKQNVVMVSFEMKMFVGIFCAPRINSYP